MSQYSIGAHNLQLRDAGVGERLHRVLAGPLLKLKQDAWWRRDPKSSAAVGTCV